MRAQTRTLHEDIERRLVLSRDTAARAEYIAYACALYGWMASWESQLWQADWPTELEARQRDGKRDWLRADLAALDVALPRDAAPPPELSTLPARFGVAYVIEGSQLGGSVLARRLAPSLPIVPRYLIGYGPELGARWKSFLAALEHHITVPADIERAAQSAHDTFASLSEWFTKHGAA